MCASQRGPAVGEREGSLTWLPWAGLSSGGDSPRLGWDFSELRSPKAWRPLALRPVLEGQSEEDIGHSSRVTSGFAVPFLNLRKGTDRLEQNRQWGRARCSAHSSQAFTPGPRRKGGTRQPRIWQEEGNLYLVKKGTDSKQAAPSRGLSRLPRPGPVSISSSEERRAVEPARSLSARSKGYKHPPGIAPTWGSGDGGGRGNSVKPVVLRTVTKLVRQRHQPPTPQRLPKEPAQPHCGSA